jgi:hypothetical protein
VHRQFQLFPAVASQRTRDVSCETFTVKADKDVLGTARIAMYERGVILFVTVVPKPDDLKVAESRRKVGDCCDPYAHAMPTNPVIFVFASLVEQLIDSGAINRHSSFSVRGFLAGCCQSVCHPHELAHKRIRSLVESLLDRLIVFVEGTPYMGDREISAGDDHSQSTQCRKHRGAEARTPKPAGRNGHQTDWLVAVFSLQRVDRAGRGCE